MQQYFDMGEVGCEMWNGMVAVLEIQLKNIKELTQIHSKYTK